MERCQSCGRMKWICHNDDPDIQIEISEDICYVTAKIDAQRRADSKKDDGSTDGVAYGTDVYVASDTPQDEFRDPYYIEQLKIHEAVVSTRKKMPREHPPGWSPEEEDA